MLLAKNANGIKGQHINIHRPQSLIPTQGATGQPKPPKFVDKFISITWTANIQPEDLGVAMLVQISKWIFTQLYDHSWSCGFVTITVMTTFQICFL